MIDTLCLGPAALAAFVSMLNPEIVEPVDDKIIIHAEAGKVEWIYIEDLKLFAVEGNRTYCIPAQAT